MPSRMAWVQRPSCLIKLEGSARAFRGSYFGFIEANIDNQSKSLLDSQEKNCVHIKNKDENF